MVEIRYLGRDLRYVAGGYQGRYLVLVMGSVTCLALSVWYPRAEEVGSYRPRVRETRDQTIPFPIESDTNRGSRNCQITLLGAKAWAH